MLADFRKEIQKGGVSPAGKAKTFYRFVGSHGTIIDVAYDDMKHAGKHNLTDEQIQAIEENNENFLAVYQETKRKGNYGGIPILAKIKTPIGEAGVVYEFLPNGRVFLKTMFFDKPAAIDNWMKKSGSSKSLLDESKSSSTGNRFSIQSIQKELGIVNAGSASSYLSQEEVRTQKEAVRKQYEGTAMWMKAPNGKDTNLTEEQWLLVRTPAFKAWFGDWEYIANAYPSVTAKERIEAKEILKTLRNKDLVSRDENIVARISKEGRSKLVSDAALHKSQKNGFSIEEHYTAVANIKKLFEASVRSQVKEDKNKEITAFESFSAPIMFEKGIAIATLSVKVTKEAKTGRSIYSIELMELKKSGGTIPSQVQKPTSDTPDLSILNISKIADKVNNASKVVDENGEPLVVYHGSDAEFDVFDSSKGRSGMNIQGMFFSPWKIDAQGYGGNVRAFFLNIKNPANEGQGYKALNRYAGQKYAGTKAREDLVANGYDDVNNNGEEYIAFEPTQIKSVDNNGNFDPEDANIYHQEAGGDTKNNLVLRQEKENTAENKESEERFIDTFLREKLPEDKRAIVEAKVNAAIEANLERMTPDNVTDIRDAMPILEGLRSTYFNEGYLRLNIDEVETAKDIAALLYGYARRCFDNDERTRRLLGRHAVGGQQGSVYRGGEEVSAGNADRGLRMDGRRGIFVRENAEYSEIMNRFKKLIEKAKKHSENQGAFSHGLLDQAAWHGSSYRFLKFILDAIGSGEGAAAKLCQNAGR